MVYRWEDATNEMAKEFQEKIENYEMKYKVKNGRSLPSNTKLIKVITLVYPIQEKDIQSYIRLHEKHICGEHLKTIKTDRYISLIWFRGNSNTLSIPRIGKKELHKLRTEVEEFIYTKKSWVRRLFSR